MSTDFKQITMAVSRSTPELVHSSFAQALHADGPDAARATELALYSWIVGPMGHGRHDDPRGMEQRIGAAARFTQVGCCTVWPSRTSGRLHACGTASPASSRCPARAIGTARRCGSTTPSSTPANPVERSGDQFLYATDRPSARPRHGPDCPEPRGGLMRWVFGEIEPHSFRWTGERAPDDRTGGAK